MLEKADFKGGLNLKFVDNPDFESLEGLDSSEAKAPIIARNVLRLLMMGWPKNWHHLISWATLKALFVHRDPLLLRELRLAFQQGFEILFHQLKDKPLNPEQREQVQLFLSNCIGVLPYSDLTPYESIQIPQYIDDQWELVEYHVTPIELTDQSEYQLHFLQDDDRVFAYGLEPLIHHRAKSLLIFMGTTYPAGQGFVSQIKTDLKAFQTVGESLYRSGRKKIVEWISRQNDKINVCGVSLGGALSLLLAIDQGDKIIRVDAQNPPGLYEYSTKSEFDNWNDLQSKPQVVIQQQAQDPVSTFGIWKKEWEVLKVTPPLEKRGPNAICDHILNYAGFADTLFSYSDPDQENKQRKTRNLLLYTIGRGAVYYPFILPYTYIFRPAGLFIWKHKLIFSLSAMSLAASTSFITLGSLGIISAPVALGLLITLSLGVGVIALPTMLSHFFKTGDGENRSPQKNKLDLAQFHDPQLPRNASMDIYSNIIEFKMPHHEFKSYYKILDQLRRDKKDVLDEDNQETLLKSDSLDDLSKVSNEMDKEDIEITIKTTKAKAFHIRHTLKLARQFNEGNERKLYELLEENDTRYRVGKRVI